MRRSFRFSRLATAAVLTVVGGVAAQPPAIPPAPVSAQTLPLPPAETTDRLLPINLATALQLANARPLDVQIAARQVTLAARQLDRAKLLWVPNLVTGLNYFRHDGGQQNFVGDIVRSSRGSLAVGVGPNVVFNLSDAIHAPLVAKQDLRARRAFQQAAANDSTLAVAEAYFWVQQSRGELAGARVALEKAEEVAKKAEKLAEGLAPPLEASRAKVELARRRQAVTTARERWRVASAELVRLLRLEPGTLVEPLEPPYLSVPVIDPTATVDSLIPIGLTNRPELAAHQAVVQAALARLKQEKLRPLVPSIALRGASTNPGGTLGWAGFGGGPNDRLNGFGGRFDMDLQVMWEFQSLGFGNKARVGERRAEQQLATLELFRAQDRIAAEVSTAFAQVTSATERMAQSEPALKDALELVDKSLKGMSQTRRIGAATTLIVRPQEVVAAVQSLGQANADYFAAVGDYNRAQFRLYRALGHPGHSLAGAVPQVTVTDALPPPGARVVPQSQVPILVSPPDHEVPSRPAELPAPRAELPPSVSPRRLPITRTMLAARPDASELRQVAHRAEVPIAQAPPAPPKAAAELSWQPIIPNTSAGVPAPTKPAAVVEAPITPAPLPVAPPAPKFEPITPGAPPATPTPKPAIPAPKPAAPKAAAIEWQNVCPVAPGKPSEPAKRKYESLFQ